MLKFDNVCKTYEDKVSSKTVLKNVSFELPEKGMVFILGKSGSGKTTILNLLGALDKVTSGSIYFEDKELSHLSNSERNSYRAHCVGFIFQEFFLIEKQSVKSNIALMGQLLQKKYSKEEISEILKEVDLEGYEDKKCNLLSSGEKQRISIARALIKDSKIILADEPTGSLDSENGERIFELLKKISATRLVVIVSHDEEAAEKYADYTIRIKDGEVIEKTGFVPENNENPCSFQIEKNHRLSMSKVIKSAMVNMKRTCFRTLLNFMICFIGLTIFFVASIMTTMDAPQRLVKGLYENHISGGTIEKKRYSLTQPNDFLTIDDVNKICETHSKLDFLKINRELGGLFSYKCNGIAEISQKFVQEQKFLYGGISSNLDGFFLTKFHAEILLDFLQGRMNPPIALTENIDCLLGYKVKVYDREFVLSGIVEDSKLPFNYAYFNEGFIDTLSDIYEKAHIEGYCTYMYFCMSGNFKTDYKFFKEYHGDNSYHQTDSKYFIRTPISDNFYRTMATYISMTDWFYGISLVQMVFVILICFNIISVSIKKNQKENGILRALGFSNFDLFKIYLLQIAFPFILLIPFAGVAGYYIIDAVNELLLTKLAVSFGLFAISPVNVVFLLLLCIGIILISTILPMIKLFKDQPINVIKAN